MAIDLSSSRTVTGPSGGVALGLGEYNQVLDYLLGLDPMEGLVKPVRGRWNLADRVAKRRNAIEVTLLQAVTGLRIAEANLITWELVDVDAAGTMHVAVTTDISKTHRARRVPVAG